VIDICCLELLLAFFAHEWKWDDEGRQRMQGRHAFQPVRFTTTMHLNCVSGDDDAR
jgi:hypothetical protein